MLAIEVASMRYVDLIIMIYQTSVVWLVLCCGNMLPGIKVEKKNETSWISTGNFSETK